MSELDFRKFRNGDLCGSSPNSAGRSVNCTPGDPGLGPGARPTDSPLAHVWTLSIGLAWPPEVAPGAGVAGSAAARGERSRCRQEPCASPARG
jgi:hypothetical protein